MKIKITTIFIMSLFSLSNCGTNSSAPNAPIGSILTPEDKPKHTPKNIIPTLPAPPHVKKVCYRKGPSAGPQFYKEVVATLKKENFAPPIELIDCPTKADCDSVDGPVLILDVWGAARKNIAQSVFNECANSILVVVREANAPTTSPIDPTSLPHSKQKNYIIPVLHILKNQIYAGKDVLEQELAQW